MCWCAVKKLLNLSLCLWKALYSGPPIWVSNDHNKICTSSVWKAVKWQNQWWWFIQLDFLSDPRTITRSSLTISLWQNEGLLTAFITFFESAIRGLLTRSLSCFNVLPKVALACSFARLDSIKIQCRILMLCCALHMEIQGLSHWPWVKDKTLWILPISRSCFR